MILICCSPSKPSCEKCKAVKIADVLAVDCRHFINIISISFHCIQSFHQYVYIYIYSIYIYVHIYICIYIYQYHCATAVQLSSDSADVTFVELCWPSARFSGSWSSGNPGTMAISIPSEMISFTIGKPLENHRKTIGKP